MSEETERPKKWSGIRFAAERDFDVFSSGLIALFDKSLIDRSEVRTALREWGLALDERDDVVTEVPADEDPANRLQRYMDRLYRTPPAQWEDVLEEYHGTAKRSAK